MSKQHELKINPKDQPTIKPISILKAALYFGLCALLFRLALYQGIPLLIDFGLSAFEANVVAYTIPSAILFALAFGFSKRDGFASSIKDIKFRLRLKPMNAKDWIWALGGLVVTFMSIGALSATALFLTQTFPIIAPPEYFSPWLKLGATFEVALFANFIGSSLINNWGVVALFVVMLFFNIVGEELWWRGYILPAQEVALKNKAWIVNGLFWWLWHLAFYPWQVFALLPICFILPYITQRRKNTTVALVIHLQNAIILVLILAMVLGFVK